MSEDRESFVRIDRLDTSERFLQERKLIVPNTARDDLMSPSEWEAGPRVKDALQFPQDWGPMANSGVDIKLDQGLFDAVENYAPPACPACKKALDEVGHWDLLEWWAHNGEPAVECPECGTRNRLGDWLADDPNVVGAPSVTFNNWPPIKEELAAELLALLGGRARQVRAHL
ncbi:hypothetical protein [Yimella sp. cx-51]|uniref:hypothetical protein n=1 Tax=Yimella sp. cx-51 TaxID=2770551 RepID=UPI00165D4853|nr:hypothetical protein [Yimella sp. cx-51]MBC9956202.1 hypothetical protein [Yimella sp. cx-51]QTH38648.1 hypothetical protein J5M86_03055 [Yimella sp. cx-51]